MFPGLLHLQSFETWAIYLDSVVSVHSQVSQTVSHCFGVLRQLRSIRCLLSHSICHSLISVLVLMKLDFGNATLVWYTIIPARSSPGGHECSGSTRLPVQYIQHHTAALPSALVLCARANNVQTGRSGLPVCPWTCASLPG